ncbi:CoA pyrophosphatase [Psychromarinibacter sp. C21-152]|uniref:CoA pyrophosphatase n=1 Tax=Psychromarinibacter sediminicola TaxID=3033385 RepID=A0AAE3NRX6_9RHOB|nr:CoA pyrophosphatase [Psychromarinibacter sediminicola]MDF0601326.1 CoA pyrophosphatase [Psychromarinibacter sediminicola]
MTASDPFARIVAALDGSGTDSSDFDLNPDFRPPAGTRYRPAGVLVPLIDTPRGLQVILTKRSSALMHHPGQIAFPGGKVDAGDADTKAAALREAREEIGLDPANVEILGQLPGHETVTGFEMVPFLGRIRAEFDAVPELGEVDEVFRVPFDHVADRARYRMQSRRWQGRTRHYYAVPYGPYYIWGATARILRGLAERLA